MKINEEVKKILINNKISVHDGISYLLSLYYGYVPSFVPKELTNKLKSVKIYRIGNLKIEWLIPLFEDLETDFEWVDDYINLFKLAKPSAPTFKQECLVRMKQFFKTYPKTTKKVVLKATTSYLNSTDSDYIRYPHFFIYKGLGEDKVSDLKSWIDKEPILENTSDTNRYRYGEII